MSNLSNFEKFHLERFTQMVEERADQPSEITANDVFEWLSTVYHFTIPENKEAGESAFNVMDYYYMEEIGVWLKKQIEKDDQFKFMVEQIDKLNTEMPCGHLARYAVNGEEGTQYCGGCAFEMERENNKSFLAELEILREFLSDVKETCELHESHMILVKTKDIPLVEKRLEFLKETS